jgi:hypothetical protein
LSKRKRLSAWPNFYQKLHKAALHVPLTWLSMRS